MDDVIVGHVGEAEDEDEERWTRQAGSQAGK